ncbi:MAG: cation:proton antiporter [Nannocystaceae bacterium]
MELTWIGVAFVLGFVAKRLKQPPLLGFLAAGFVLELLGFRPDLALEELANVGVMLLLFTIGLKLDVASVVRPAVWAATVLHLLASVIVVAAVVLGLAAFAIGPFAGLDLEAAALLGFALSFSSTVFVVKLLEERDDSVALYGRVAVGILVVQDLVAVGFLAATAESLPSPWAFALIGLIPLRPLLHRLLSVCGHGELLVLGGLAATLGGAGLFYALGLKGDLGALVAGILLGGHPKAQELSKSLYGLKDVFLVGFFLSVGLTGLPTVENLLVALGFIAFLPLKGALFFWLSARFRLRVRTSLLIGAGLTQFSEFGLIVGAVAVSRGWLDASWLVTFALCLALSFLVSSPLNRKVFELYGRWRPKLLRFETSQRVPEEEAVDAGEATILIFGMGRVGAGAYDELRARGETAIVGFDIDERVIERHREEGREVRLASATDVDFWDRLHVDRAQVSLVLLAMSSTTENLIAITQLREMGFGGVVAAAGVYDDDLAALEAAGADAAFNLLAEAGTGFADHALGRVQSRASELPA